MTKPLTVKFHSCWASNTQPSTTDLHDLGKHAVGALFMFGANGMEERWPRNRETSASFPILVLFDKQAVEHSVFKRTRTRNSFDYSQSCHRNHKICVMTPFQWILPWFNTPSQPWRQRHKRWIPQSKSTATHYRAAGINTWNIQCVTYYNTCFLARNIRIWTSPNNWHFARYSGLWRILPGHIVWQIRRILNVAMAQN